MNQIGITLSKENFDFSKRELETLMDVDEITYSDNLAVFETDDLAGLHDKLSYLSYGKKAFELLAHAEQWDEMLRDVEEADITQFAFPGESYKIDSLRIGQTHQSTDRGLLAGLTNTTRELQVNVENPDALFVHIKGNHHSFGRKIWEQDEPFTNRRNDNLPASHPTGLHPRMARAMVNLVQASDGVTDPFCGTGGILIEAGLMDLQTQGIDHDSRMIERAKTNLDGFGLSSDLVNGDTLDETYAYDTIVTDIPYGKNSTTSQEPTELFGAFLDHLRSQADRAVICYPGKKAYQDLVNVIDDDAETYDFYVNKSLTRRIAILELT